MMGEEWEWLYTNQKTGRSKRRVKRVPQGQNYEGTRRKLEEVAVKVCIELAAWSEKSESTPNHRFFYIYLFFRKRSRRVFVTSLVHNP